MVGLLFAVVFYFALGIPIGAVVLRAAVSLANRILGPPDADSQTPLEDSVAMPSSVSDPDNPYSAPKSTSVASARQDTVIPAPSFGSAYLIVLAQLILGLVVGFFIGLGMALVMGPDAGIVSPILSVVVGFGINIGVCCGMLPTTFKRGLLVTFMQILIAIAFGAIIFAVVMGVSAIA